ncbi:hypothetical protein RUND412_002266 [Rhizina undulata]
MIGFSVTAATPAFPQEFKVRIKLPFQRNHKFCGRDDIFDKIREILDPDSLAKPIVNTPETNAGRKTVVLYGLWGTGKLQIALEYAHRFRDFYTSIFWIDVENFSRTTDSACKIVEQLVSHYAMASRSSPNYHEISKRLGIPGKIDQSGRLSQGSAEFALEAVHSWLTTGENRKWLLLVDNHDKPIVGALDKLLPECDWGSVIITTRFPNLRRYGACIEVAEIGRQAGLELLQASSGITQKIPHEFGCGM